MIEKRFTMLEQREIPRFFEYLRLGTFRLLGVMWKKRVFVWLDPVTGDIVFRYE